VTISGDACVDEVVNFFLSSGGPTLIGSSTGDPVTGEFSATVTIPADFEIGPANIGAQCDDGSATMYIPFEVVAATTTTSTTTTSTTTIPPAAADAPSPDPARSVGPAANEDTSAEAPLSLAG
jgi:hypothetical protein